MKTRYLLMMIIASSVFSFIACDKITYPEALGVNPGEIVSNNFTEYEKLKIETVNAELPSDFMRGVDASEVKALEECGIKFYDSDNTEKDVFEIFSEHGVNWVRLRIWNDYTVAMDPNYGNLGTSYWAPYGWNNLSRTINMAKRAKRYGLKVLLDFHFSDTWADPSKQFLPKMWEGITDVEELSKAVADYTEEVILAMKEASCEPDMIQLGNESEGGLFKKDSNGNTLSFSHSDGAACLVEAAKVIRSVLPNCKIMLHMSAGGDTNRLNSFYTNYVDKMKDSEGNSLCDAVGLSYYPFYTNHKTVDGLASNCETIKSKGHEPVVVEVSYGYDKAAYTDTTSNSFYTDQEINSATNIPSLTKDGKIEATIENQALVVREVIEKSAQKGGAGVFYWGTCYLGVEGIMNSGYENQALFDVNGKVLPSIDVFAVKGK